MSLLARCLVGLALLAILCASGIGLLQAGVYGLTVFVVHPALLGGLACWIVRPATGKGAAGTGLLSVLLASGLLLFSRIEGLACLAMCLPLTMPLGAMGGWLVYRCEASGRARRSGLAMLLLLPPASFTWDTHARPLVFEVRTAIMIAASPEQVWRHMAVFSEMPEPREWYFRSGLAYPKLARIDGTGGVGATRTCEFSTGRVVESIEVWDEPRTLRFRVTENPAPMREWSPYGEISPKHLHGYLISREGQFRLTRSPGNHTLLEGTSWYQHGLWPAEYWRWWSDAIIHRIHLRVFKQIKTLAEADARKGV